MITLVTSGTSHDKALEDRAAALRKLGFKEFDAYHLAAAESAGCDFLVTCDDRFLKARAETLVRWES